MELIMKALALTLPLAVLLFVSNNAHALVQVPGTFTPAQCGNHQFESMGVTSQSVESVCVGEIVGAAVPAVEFRMVDGSTKLFRVSHQANFLQALKSGNIKANLFLVSDDGEQTTMRVIQSREGHVQSATGRLGDVSYLVPELKPIYCIQ
jgi:hypothetical protein